MSVEEKLLTLSKKIAFVESHDDDYTNNEKWKKLRQQQDSAYLELAREKLDRLNEISDERLTDKQRQDMEFYTNYIEEHKNHEEENELQ